MLYKSSLSKKKNSFQLRRETLFDLEKRGKEIILKRDCFGSLHRYSTGLPLKMESFPSLFKGSFNFIGFYQTKKSHGALSGTSLYLAESHLTQNSHFFMHKLHCGRTKC